MSRSKSKPDYLRQVRRNENELNQAYIREKRFKQDRFKNPFDGCLDCSISKRTFGGMCKECNEQSIEDLVTVYENNNQY